MVSEQDKAYLRDMEKWLAGDYTLVQASDHGKRKGEVDSCIKRGRLPSAAQIDFDYTL